MRGRAAALGGLLLAAGCGGGSPTEPAPAALVSVLPVNGATGVAAEPIIVVEFDAPLAPSAPGVVALQIGACPGPVVSGTWRLSEQRTLLRFTPDEPLQPGTLYTIHLGGAVTDENGNVVDIETAGPGLGGAWVTEAQVLGMERNGMGMSPHAAPGWQHANGFYGLSFEFTTGG